MEKEENSLKFYYCESENSYLIGIRIGTFYYDHSSEWEKCTYPAKLKEIDFSDWLNGFIN